MILPLSITRGLTQHFHRELYNIQKPAGALKRVSQLCTVSLLLSLAPKMLLSIPNHLMDSLITAGLENSSMLSHGYVSGPQTLSLQVVKLEFGM